MKLRGGSNKLSKLYYSTNGYWKGYAAISKLAHTAKVSEDEAKQRLEKQAFMANLFTSSKIYSETPLDSE